VPDDCTITPASGTAVNLNDRTNTFVMNEVDVGYKRTEFDEVRSYTGAIRQLDVHQPLIDMTIPMKVKGSSMAATITNIKAACIAGGTITWGGVTYTYGMSPEPEIRQDALYKLRSVALFEIKLKRLP